MVTIETVAKEVSTLVPKLITGIKGSLMLHKDVTGQQMIMILLLNEIGVSKINTLSAFSLQRFSL